MSDYVYSELNRNLVNVDYEGVKTDSARVTVDNGQRTIAVDFTRLPKSLFIEDGSAIREYNGSEELRININDYFIREIETTEFAKKYAPKSVLEVDSGKLDSIAMSRITKYKFIVCHGYKFGVSEPNQAEFVLMPQLIAAGTADVSVYCSALGSDSDAGLPFKIRFSCSADGQTLSWYTYPTYGDSSEKGKFYITQILGVY